MRHTRQESTAELIDTLWNVNQDNKKAPVETSGINRYIMECKYQKRAGHQFSNLRINRYIMECKLVKILLTADGILN